MWVRDLKKNECMYIYVTQSLETSTTFQINCTPIKRNLENEVIISESQ